MLAYELLYYQKVGTDTQKRTSKAKKQYKNDLKGNCEGAVVLVGFYWIQIVTQVINKQILQQSLLQ